MRAAVGFLTIFGGASRPDGRTMAWFPAIGAAIGLALGGVWWAAAELWPPLLAAVVVVAADLLITGLLHVDGLSDSADGLLPPLGSRERRLAVMADPTAGAFGVAVVATMLALRVGALAAIRPDALGLAAIWCASRTLMATAALGLTYVRPGGLASDFVGPAARRLVWPVTLGGLLVAGALAAAGNGWHGLIALTATIGGGALVLWLAHRRIGGYTGDVLGAAAMTAETTGLLALAARG